MYTVPDLPYDIADLQPHIDQQTMSIHHSKHHTAYVNNLNNALKGHDDLLAQPIEELLTRLHSLPEDIKTAVQNNGGGHANHSLFWTIMSPDGGGTPAGTLGKAIDETFGSFDAFKTEFAKAASTRFGSGWAWLVLHNGTLEIMSTTNQDSPLSEGKLPILGLDVWEHAYYLTYQNRRPDYITAWWDVVNWKEVERRYAEGV